MERKPGITFTPWETVDEGVQDKRQTPPSLFSRNFDTPVNEDRNEADFQQNQNVKDLSSGTADAQIGTISLFGVPIVCLCVEGKERLCLAQISNTLLRDFSYNEIHNRRVALGITCMQCSPIQLEVLRRSGAMPVSSRRCGLITKREAERLVKSFLEDIPPPKLPENFSFQVEHTCGWGCQGMFMPSRYNSSRAKCIKCITCNSFFSPNKFIFHYHKTSSSAYRHPDAANFNSWRRHLHLVEKSPPESLLFAWEDVKAMFNGGCRKRTSGNGGKSTFSLSPTRTRESTDFKPPAVPTMMRSYPGLQNTDLYRLNMAEQMQASFPMQASHSSTVASYGDMLRSMSLNYTPWWKSLYMQRHGVHPTCNIPFSPDFNITNYGHPQFPLPLIDTSETFVDEMTKLSEITTNPDKKEKKIETNMASFDRKDLNRSLVSSDEDTEIRKNGTRNDDQVSTTKCVIGESQSIDKETKPFEEQMDVNTDVTENKTDDINVEGDDSNDEDMFDDNDLDNFSVDKLKEFLMKAKQMKKMREKKSKTLTESVFKS